jgi:DNA polymerase-1
MTSNKKEVYLIDGSGYIHRAYHAVRHLSTSKGLPTNATFGFTNMLLKLVGDRNPEYMAMAYDAKGPTFRHKIYDAYKANRPAMPEDLVVQLPYIKEVVEGLNISALEVPGYEADDIIGTLAVAAEKKGFRVVIVTGDKDFRQIVSPLTRIYDPMKDRVTDYAALKEKFGLEPSQLVDVMALAGDASDNIPGVPGIGEKTALQLIKSYGDMDRLFEHLDEVTKNKVRENLRTFREQAFVSRRLVAINTNAPVTADPSLLKASNPNRKRLAELFQSLEFRRLQEIFPLTRDLSEKDYRAIVDEEDLKGLVRQLEKAQVFALDLETTSKNPMGAAIVGLSFAWESDKAVYIPVGHRQEGAEKQLRLEDTLIRLKPLLEDPKVAKVGQNIKYDWIVLRRSGIELQGVISDTMVASYLLNPALRVHSLTAIAAEYLDHRMITYKEVTGGRDGYKGFQDVPVAQAVPYACEDADVTLMAHKELEPRLREKGLASLFKEVEIPLIGVLVEMEMTGVCVDRARLQSISKDFEHQLEVLEERIYAISGEEFNIQSHQQLGQILFEKLKLPVQKKTKKKTGYSTDVQVLTTLSPEHELPALVLQYRSLAKLKSTYADALVTLIHPETQRIHTSYNQTVTATGRLSSSDPNLQNIPIRTEEGRKVRAAFIPREGWSMLSADYSQIELRLLAHYSGDPILVEAFQKDEDIHSRTAAEVFQLFPSMITPEMRRQAKVINFGIIYGMGPFRLAKELGISHQMAKTYIEHYFARYTGVKDFTEKIVKEARQTGKVTTLLGRHRWLPDISSPNRTAREAAERTAINMPLQGTAADLIKVAMVRIRQAFLQERLRSKMLLQVHDELVFEVPPEAEEETERLVREIMEGVIALRVPLKVEMNRGRNWAEAH